MGISITVYRQWKIGNWLAGKRGQQSAGWDFSDLGLRGKRWAFFHALAHPFLVLDKGVKLKAVLLFLLKKWNIKKSRCLICSTPDSQDAIKSVIGCLYTSCIRKVVHSSAKSIIVEPG